MKGWFLAATILFSILPAAPAYAAMEPAPFCAPDESPHFAFGIAALRDAIGPVMGDPVECEHPNNANGDTLQQTTTGLAIYRQSSNSAEFTDGWNHWALTADGVSTWSGNESQASAASPPGIQCVDVGAGLCFKATGDVAGTVGLLTHLNTAAPLLQTAARANYMAHAGDLPVDVLGLFRPSRHDVVLSTELGQYPEVDRGPILAHELQHVSDWVSQGPALESLKGCLATETAAFQAESAVWLELQGGHLPKPTNDLERELNLMSQAIASDPEGFASHLTLVYRDQCDIARSTAR